MEQSILRQAQELLERMGKEAKGRGRRKMTYDPEDRTRVLIWMAETEAGYIPYRLQKLAAYKLIEIAGFTLTKEEMDGMEEMAAKAQKLYDKNWRKDMEKQANRE
jgi:diketogulonate reductase-like aldo/keto reductase